MMLMTPGQWWQWLTVNANGLIVPVGAVTVVVLMVLLVRAIRKGTADAWAVTFSTLIALGFSAEGMFEVTREKLTQLPLSVAAVLFLVGEAAMFASMVRAHRHYHRINLESREPNRNLGRHGIFVWVIALTLGFVVSLNSANPVEYCIRLLMPALAAGMWWMGYQDDTIRRTNGATTWRWHPRRVAILLGIIEPGDGDIAKVHRERHTRKMTTLAHKVHTGSAQLVGWRAARLTRLALRADDDIVSDVTARVQRAHAIVALTDPATTTTPRRARAPRVESGDDRVPTRSANGRLSSAERVAKAAARMPDASAAKIAAKLGLSERTVQRYRPVSSAQTPADLQAATS